MLAVTGGKGGCGKTTTVLGLAQAIARAGGRPLVVDADVDVPDLHIQAEVRPEPGLAAVATGQCPAGVAQSSPAVPGVAVLPAGPTRRCPPAALERLAACSRPVLVDCPAGAGPDAVAPLRAATGCLIVSTTAPESRQDAAKTAGVADALDVPIVGTVLRQVVAESDDGRSPDPAGDRAGFDDEPVVSIPAVAGSPLRNDQVRDRYDYLRNEIERRYRLQTGSIGLLGGLNGPSGDSPKHSF